MRAAFAALLVGSLAAGLFFQASFLHLILIFALAVWLLVPTLAVMSAAGFFGLVRGTPPSPHYRQATVLLCGTMASLAFSYAVGCAIYDGRTIITHHEVSRIVPVLIQAKQRTGVYPPLPPGWPGGFYSMLGFPVTYTSSGSDFAFSYDDPCGVMDHFEFDGSAPVWRHHGD